MNRNNTKEELLDLANQLIKNVGVNAMSYADLSREIGISKASIHHHFPKKEDLIIALLQRTNRIYGEMFAEILHSQELGLEKVYQIAWIYEPGQCSGKKCLLGVLSAEYGSLGEQVQIELKRSVEVPVGALEQAFAQAIAQGSLRVGSDARVLAHSFYALILGAQLVSHSGPEHSFRKTICLFVESL